MTEQGSRLLEVSKKFILGKDHEIKLAYACLIANGHLLSEDIPGVGKTTLVKFLAKSLGLPIGRIQFTNDLLPADIIGVNIYKRGSEEFQFHQGPIFSNVVLADELNRGTPKTQSALLQAMEEHQVSVDANTYPLPRPFFVIATQNPRSQIGTHPLPESQLDRFLMKIELGPPDRESERALLTGKSRLDMINEMQALMNTEELLELQQKCQNIHISDAVSNYILDILEESRKTNKYLDLSPRAGMDLVRASKSWALIHGRDYIMPNDVQEVAPYVLGHRLARSGGTSVDAEQSACRELLEEVPVL